MLLQLVSLFTAITQVLFVHPPVVSSQSTVNASRFADAPPLSATSAFLIDTTTGTIVHGKNADVEVPIASITKLMAALVILDQHPRLDGQITFEERDMRRGDITQLIVQDVVTFHDAWKLMLVGSSNDATALLARTVSGSEKKFVVQMNAKAKQLGLTHTRFTDPTGLDPGNVSTAREVAAFARRALAEREIQETVVIPRFSFAPKGKPARIVYSTDQLLHWFDPGRARSFGGKTGHIEESGYNLVFAMGTDQHELVGVVLGSESNDARFSEMGKLLSWGFKVASVAP